MQQSGACCQVYWWQLQILLQRSSPQAKCGAPYRSRVWMVFSPHPTLHWWQVLHAQAKQGNTLLMTTPECSSSRLLSPSIYRILFILGWLCMCVWVLIIHTYILSFFVRSESVYACVFCKYSITQSRIEHMSRSKCWERTGPRSQGRHLMSS